MVLVATALERFWDPAIAALSCVLTYRQAYKGKTSRRPHPPLRVWSKVMASSQAPNETRERMRPTAQVLNGNMRTKTTRKQPKRSRAKRNAPNKTTQAKRNTTQRCCAPMEWPHEPHTRCGGTIANETQKRDAGRKAQDPRRTTYPLRGCVVIVRSSSELTTKPPRNATYERNPPKPQPNEARHQQSTRRDHDARPQETQTEPHTRRSGVWFLPSVKTHPTSTQTSPQYAQPPKPGVPAPNTTTKYRVPHTPRRCVVITCTLSQRENPPHKKGRAQHPTPIPRPKLTPERST
ncbi:hypothetical protein BS47DRAFT_1368690 [Hydnum rufescens UP504]|uniref:Uncharacterized protein n=1 Tax=Hydnum rufescens UP504 TaxID=1448309 RepID=A0A9P6AEU9_9AGAM|nr:hypothetical protein BS47DRAFT_1368690 [Hydnum rufescens UP504]